MEGARLKLDALASTARVTPSAPVVTLGGKNGPCDRCAIKAPKKRIPPRQSVCDTALRPCGVVVISEPGRSLTATEIEAVLGRPIVATVPYDVAISRAVDSGLLTSRVPRLLARALRHLVPTLTTTQTP